MVSTYPPDRDGIASYTARLENALRRENVAIKVAANGRDWKKNSPAYIFSIIRKAVTSRALIVHIQLSYSTFGNEYYTGLFPLLSLTLKLLGKRVVVTFHDIVQKSNVNDDLLKNRTSTRFLKFKKWALSNFTRIVCSTADKVIVHSEAAQNVLNRDYAISKKIIQVIPHGIDQVTCLADEDWIENEPLTNKDRHIVSYFGLVKQGKGLEDLLMAWKKVRSVNAQLLIIGGKHPTINDNYYENLTSLVKDLGLDSSIRFCGYVPDEILPTYLGQSEAFVLPYNEWGDVIASSGALSIVAPYLKPIVATDVPAFQHLKKLGAAVIVKKGDVDGLAAAIQNVLTDIPTRHSLKTHLYKWLPESSWSVVARRTATLYTELG
jgi:glycosyltransferase involved in cell wall biosynthesis